MTTVTQVPWLPEVAAAATGVHEAGEIVHAGQEMLHAGAANLSAAASVAEAQEHKSSPEQVERLRTPGVSPGPPPGPKVGCSGAGIAKTGCCQHAARRTRWISKDEVAGKTDNLKVEPKRLSSAVSKVVFSPTILAYGWIIVHYQVSGFVLYGAAMTLAYKMQLFEHVRQWPRSSRMSLAVGPVLLVVGAAFSLMRTAYWMLIPGFAYMLLIMVGGLALKGKTFEAEAGE